MLRLMSVKAYAEKMDCAESTIRKMCSKGGLLYAVSVKIGVGYKIDAEAADAIFRQQMEAKQQPAVRVRRKQKTAFLDMIAEKQRELKECV